MTLRPPSAPRLDRVSARGSFYIAMLRFIKKDIRSGKRTKVFNHVKHKCSSINVDDIGGVSATHDFDSNVHKIAIPLKHEYSGHRL